MLQLDLLLLPQLLLLGRLAAWGQRRNNCRGGTRYRRAGRKQTRDLLPCLRILLRLLLLLLLLLLRVQ